MSPLAPVRLAALVCASLACAGPPHPAAAPIEPAAASAQAPACDPARDRAAIRGMAGSFQVRFEFAEVEALRPGYALAEPYEAQSTEVVSVLEDSERRVVLQHVLLVENDAGALEAMKHWRQDWTYEDRELLEFRGERRWTARAVAPEQARCSWSQAVFQVDDGPRYESQGRWVHEPARSTWTSGETWRPLPRREAKRAGEYDVLVGTNRHVVTPQGWDHEQDNRKWILREGAAFARERGANRYARSDLGASARIASRYLAQTGAFWAQVRAVWDDLLRGRASVRVQDEIDGKPLYEQLFRMSTAPSRTPATPRAIREAVAPFVQESIARR